VSYNLDGKLSNQYVRSDLRKPKCSKCNKTIDTPAHTTMEANNKLFSIRHYIGTPHYIYETKSGHSAVYCSDYCRKKHNHRFRK
jgi:hypothetical protein